MLAVLADAVTAVCILPTELTPLAQARIADELWARRMLAEVPAHAYVRVWEVEPAPPPPDRPGEDPA